MTKVKVIQKKQPPERFYNKAVFENFFQNLQESTCVKVSFFNKVEPLIFIKKEILAQVFPVNF